MGIKTVAVYSDADRGARHVAMQTRRCISAARRARELSRADKIIDRAAKADRPHRRSIRATASCRECRLREACAKAGLVFIGPPPAAIRAMGSKSEAKKIMEKAKVPLVPGYPRRRPGAALLAKEAARIGFPVLIKARRAAAAPAAPWLSP